MNSEDPENTICKSEAPEEAFSLAEKFKMKANKTGTLAENVENNSENEETKRDANNNETSKDGELFEGETDIKQIAEDTTFESLGVCQEICKAVEQMGYKHPSRIQKDSLPYTLQGRDIIGLAETGSGKTAAFAIPVIQQLLDAP